MEPTPAYRPQLDGLRAMASLVVLVHHFWTETFLGHQAVRLFFVLSGFLITSLLLRAREIVPHYGARRLLKMFYMRRALRIVPAYMLAIGVAAAIDLPDVRQDLAWHLTYTGNWLIVLQGWRWPPHLWTLCVEEQFYLAWPFVIIFCPQKWTRRVLWAVIALAVVFRITAIVIVGSTGPAGLWVATPASFDALAAGSLVAVAVRDRPLRPQLARALAMSLIPLAALGALAHHFLSPAADYVVGELVWLAPAAVLVTGCWIGFAGVLGRVLGARVPRYFGKLSYGIYLYHYFVWALLGIVAADVGLQMPEPGWRLFVITASATVLVASLSWHLIEHPLNGLKRRLVVAPARRDNAIRKLP